MEIFHELVLVLAIAVVIVAMLQRIHMPAILGYLLAGTIVGPSGLKLFDNVRDLDFVAEFGVVFLLFAIGLELSFPKLMSMRRALLGLGGLQVLLCTLIVTALGQYAGLHLGAAITIAGALALSSTAVVTKQLIEQDELHQEHGKLSLSILLFQDLAAIPFLIIVPALGQNAPDVSLQETILSTTLMGGAIFLFMLGLGRWVLRPLFQHIAAARSSELFMLTALLVVLGSAFLTESFHLSLALGAFLAGVMLAETEYVHQIESDILPFRDVLLGLFFITVGMNLNPQILIEEFKWVAAIVLAIIFIKFFIISILTMMTRSTLSASLRTGFVLAQGGEFGFALLALAQDGRVISPHVNQIIIAAIFLSLTIAPFIIRYNGKLAQWICKLFKAEALQEPLQNITERTEKLSDHVIICGYGRVGQTLARFLEHEGIPFIGLDLDPLRLREAKAAGEPVFFGDACDLAVLKASQVDSARLLIIAFKDPARAEKILQRAHTFNPVLPILVRTEDDRHLEALQKAGATEVIPEKLESSLMLASHMMILLGIPANKVQQQISEVKTNRYRMLQGFFIGIDDTEHLEEALQEENLHAIELPSSAFAIGKTMEELQSEECPIPLSSFSRSGFKCSQIAPNTILQAGDVLVLKGTPDILFLAEEKLLSG